MKNENLLPLRRATITCCRRKRATRGCISRKVTCIPFSSKFSFKHTVKEYAVVVYHEKEVELVKSVILRDLGHVHMRTVAWLAVLDVCFSVGLDCEPVALLVSHE